MKLVGTKSHESKMEMREPHVLMHTYLTGRSQMETMLFDEKKLTPSWLPKKLTVCLDKE